MHNWRLQPSSLLKIGGPFLANCRAQREPLTFNHGEVFRSFVSSGFKLIIQKESVNKEMSNSTSVDVVYLWVSGNDPAWRAKRKLAARHLHSDSEAVLAPFSNVEGRFRDNDELRYSLRALERFFPEHGHVYIVTDGQTPKWLSPAANLTVIDHRDLIPSACLPIFDSGNIESYIHRIPGLSERYFYLNDDVFFGAPVNLQDWFWEGGVYVAWSNDPEVTDEALRADSTSLENGSRLSNKWLLAKAQAQACSESSQERGDWRELDVHYQHTFRIFAHAPRAMLKSVLFELEHEAADLFELVRSTVFRQWDSPTIVSDFVLRWMLAHGMARVKEYTHIYLSTGLDGHEQELKDLHTHFGALEFFCINDTTDDARMDDPRLRQTREMLQLLLSTPSGFEGPHGDSFNSAVQYQSSPMSSGRSTGCATAILLV